MNFASLETKAIFSIISAILLIGNMQVDDSSLTDENPCKISNLNVF